MIIAELVTRCTRRTLERSPGLSYLETSNDDPAYRFQTTFNRNVFNFRLLMVLYKFSVKIFGRAGVSPDKLIELRDRAFSLHGALPDCTSEDLVNDFKKINSVKGFDEMMVVLDMNKPNPKEFAQFLRNYVEVSEENGYHKMPLNQQEALWCRLQADLGVATPQGMRSIRPRRFCDCAGGRVHDRDWRGGRGRGRGVYSGRGRGGYGGPGRVEHGCHCVGHTGWYGRFDNESSPTPRSFAYLL